MMFNDNLCLSNYMTVSAFSNISRRFLILFSWNIFYDNSFTIILMIVASMHRLTFMKLATLFVTGFWKTDHFVTFNII